MRQYFSKHKYHLIALFVLLITVGVSWHLSLTTQNTSEITNSKLQIPNKISNNKSQTPKEYPKSPPHRRAGNIPTSSAGGQYPDETQNTDNKTQLQITTTSTALEAMRSAKLNFKTKTFSGLGEFVEEINGLKNDPQTGKYWGYFINGESAKLGISTQMVVPGDLIEWQYGNANFTN